jgi:hypothetical protein
VGRVSDSRGAGKGRGFLRWKRSAEKTKYVCRAPFGRVCLNAGAPSPAPRVPFFERGRSRAFIASLSVLRSKAGARLLRRAFPASLEVRPGRPGRAFAACARLTLPRPLDGTKVRWTFVLVRPAPAPAAFGPHARHKPSPASPMGRSEGSLRVARRGMDAASRDRTAKARRRGGSRRTRGGLFFGRFLLAEQMKATCRGSATHKYKRARRALDDNARRALNPDNRTPPA